MGIGVGVGEVQDLLNELMMFDTRAGASGVGPCVAWLHGRLVELGFAVQVERSPGRSPLIVARRPARGRGVCVVYNHYDADGPGQVPTRASGRLIGPGVADNKGPLATRIAALARADRAPEVLWVIQGEEEAGSALARTVLSRLLGGEPADVYIDESGWFDADGTQRILAHVASRARQHAADSWLASKIAQLTPATPWPVRVEVRALDKRLVPGGCAFQAALPEGARYLSIGHLDAQTRIHQPSESIAEASLVPAVEQFASLLAVLAA